MKSLERFLFEAALEDFRKEKEGEYHKKYGKDWKDKLTKHVWSHFKKDSDTKAKLKRQKKAKKRILVHPHVSEYTDHHAKTTKSQPKVF